MHIVNSVGLIIYCFVLLKSPVAINDTKSQFCISNGNSNLCPFFKDIHDKSRFTEMKNQTSCLWSSWPENKLDFNSF